jgi:beta-glucanase (GH16 family)
VGHRDVHLRLDRDPREAVGRAGTLSPADTNWHVYGLTRTPTAVTWSVDGATTCTQRTVVPTDPMFLIINNAMGGDGGGRIDPGDFPQTMVVDYVRVKKT